MDLSLESVMKCLKESRLTPIAVALLTSSGLTKTQFHELLKQIEPTANESMIDLLRMNICGGLRGSGFVLEGGRKGRHLPYRRIGYEEPRSKENIQSWNSKFAILSAL